MYKTYLVIFLCFFLSNLSFADQVALEGAEVGKWTMDIDAAYKLAEEKKLPIIINFTGSDWCYWCKIMDKNVFAKDTWKNYAKDKLILVTIDFPRNPSIVPEKYKQRNKEIAEEFEIQGYPTYVLLNNEKEVVAEMGAGKEKTPESFQGEIQAALHLSPEGIKETLAKLSPQDKAQYSAILEERQKRIDALQAWIQTEPEQTEENMTKYQNFVKNIQDSEKKLSKYW